jgi:segregation and condensation protein A
MQFLDLELAGEFILMASTLMYIKTQMLLPRHEDENSEEPEDPRTQLVQKLLEYKKYKEAASDFGDRFDENKYNYYRRLFDADYEAEEHYKNANLFDLINAFNKLMKRNKDTSYQHVVESFQISIEEMSAHILERVSSKRRLGFFNLVQDKPVAYIVVAFLSILELIKRGKIFIIQKDNFEDIVIAPHPIETKELLTNLTENIY